ncbi:MAG TPA: dipeptide ABC transporter ATP-binding protein [Thermohalobaculum sp.]|nr:dipeptide ABC transporter ATP-binding protein [Thermohalobaculum sp.]
MTAPLLLARDLSRHYEVSRGPLRPAAIVRALNGVSLSLEAGKTLAVVGESGCGKSTLARVLTMIEPPTGGSLDIDGAPIDISLGRPSPELRRSVQIVFQNPYGSLNPRKTVAAMLDEPLRLNTDLDATARRAAAVEMIRKVGLRPEHADRYPHMFSGGQRQRIAIARALMLNPKILVLDEPVSALDLSIRAQILNLLADLQEEFGLSYLFISHDLSVVRRIASQVMVMYLGRPVEEGPAEAIFANPRHPYTRALFSATPVADPERRRERIRLQGEPPSPLAPPTGCPFHPRCPLKIDRCAEAYPDRATFGDQQVACWRAGEAMPPSTPLAIA